MTRLYSGRLSIFQSCAIDDSRLGAAAFRVLACLGTYSDEQGWCRPSQATMGKRLGISRQAVQKQIKTLEELGYLEIRHRFNTKNKGQLPSWYRLILDYQLPDEFRREPLPPEEEPPPQSDVAPPATSQVAPPSTPEIALGATSEVARTTHLNDSKNDRSSTNDKDPDPTEPHAKRLWHSITADDWRGLPARVRELLPSVAPLGLSDGMLCLKVPNSFNERMLTKHVDAIEAVVKQYHPGVTSIEIRGPNGD